VIRDVIAARGLSGSSVADEAEVDHRVVNRFLAGKRGLSIETTDKLARALGLRLVEGRGGLRRR
jgi:ribosome-binding protein aMBF1 (putative translation factor)